MESPNKLNLKEENKVEARRLPRWPLYVVIAGALIMGAVLVYGVSFSDRGQSGPGQKAVAISDNDPPLFLMDNRGGLASLPPASPLPETSTLLPVPPSAQEPIVVVQRSNDPQDEARRQELENLRRRRAQAQLEGLTAPLSVKRSSLAVAAGVAPVDGGGAAGSQGGRYDGLTLPGMDGGYDMAAQKDKEEFFSRSTQNSWTLPHTREAGQRYELKTDRIIPATLITGINSDLPGQILAEVRQDVYDTATGDFLLIPKGTKLTGAYDSRVIYGQRRVLLAINRLVYPDGSALDLGAMPASDLSGYAGMEDQVNNHYLRIFGSAFLMSMISGGTAWAVDSLDNSSGDSDKPSMQQELGTALASQLGQASLSLLQKNLNISPTLEIRPGFTFNVIVSKDIVFDRPYAPYR